MGDRFNKKGGRQKKEGDKKTSTTRSVKAAHEKGLTVGRIQESIKGYFARRGTLGYTTGS